MAYTVDAAVIRSVNVGRATATKHSRVGRTGIDKRPVTGPVELRDPGPRGVGASGVAGDDVCDLGLHGGADQAVYAYALEDYAAWSAELGIPLRPGVFGENLTTAGVDLTNTLIGEHWQVGSAVLEVSAPRTPCRTFAAWLGVNGWLKLFNARAVPGAYFRVLRPGAVQAGDQVRVLSRPDHSVTIGLTFRALTLETELLPQLRPAKALPEAVRRRAGSPELLNLEY